MKSLKSLLLALAITATQTPSLQADCCCCGCNEQSTQTCSQESNDNCCCNDNDCCYDDLDFIKTNQPEAYYACDADSRIEYAADGTATLHGMVAGEHRHNKHQVGILLKFTAILNDSTNSVAHTISIAKPFVVMSQKTVEEYYTMLLDSYKAEHTATNITTQQPDLSNNACITFAFTATFEPEVYATMKAKTISGSGEDN